MQLLQNSSRTAGVAQRRQGSRPAPRTNVIKMAAVAERTLVTTKSDEVGCVWRTGATKT